MQQNRRSQARLVAIMLALLGSALVVAAAMSNYSNETNSTIEEFALKFTEEIVPNQSLETISNQSLEIENNSLGATEENSSAPQQVEETIPENIKEEKKKLKDIAKNRKNKLNEQTFDFIEQLEDETEGKSFIVKYKDDFQKTKFEKFEKEYDSDALKLAHLYGKAEDIADILDDDMIEFVELDQEINPLEDSIGYNIENVKAPQAWNLSKGNGTKIAVLDTGIAEHSDLSIAGGYSVVSGSYEDTHGHGTLIAGVVAATLNDEGIVGIAPEASLYAVKIMEGSSGSLSDAIAGVEWAIENDMDIVSMSFGFDSYSQIFKDVLEEAYEDEGILLIAASGNEGTDEILYPAAYDSVIAVGSVDENNALAASSSYGFDQELVAPGVDIESTSLNDGYSTASGTSMAAPHVTGVAALIKSYNNSMTNEQIRAKLRNDALDLGDSGKDDYFGYGLVQTNLATNNFTFMSNSYFYEIFNITDFRTENEAYWFWLSGNGSIGDVDFEEGLYLVNITFSGDNRSSELYNVSSNGTIEILDEENFLQRDNFTQEGENNDGILWTDGTYEVNLQGSFPPGLDGECYDTDNDLNPLEYCFFEDDDAEDRCDADYSEIDCGGATICDDGATIPATWHNILDTTSKDSHIVTGWYYFNCSIFGSDRAFTDNTENVYVVDMKRARCLNSSDFVIEGRYAANSWAQIGNSQACTSTETCVFNGTNSTNPNEVLDPCLTQNTCTGTIQVITEDENGNALKDILVTRDNISNKTTNVAGVAEYNFTKTCKQDLEFVVKCGINNQTECGRATTKLDMVGDYEGLPFDCTVCTGTVDLQINAEDVRTNVDSDTVTVNISLLNVPVTSNIQVYYKVQSNDGLIAREDSENFTSSSGQRFQYFSKELTLTNNDDFVHVYVDNTNKVHESNEKNNYAMIPLFEKKLNVYFDISTGYPKVDNEIKEYLKLYVNEESNQELADLTLCVGKKCSNFNTLNDYTLNHQSKSQKFGYKNNQITFNNKVVGKGKPYNAIVGGFSKSNGLSFEEYIMAYGNDIDGDIAAVKKLVSGRELFFSKATLLEEKTKVVDDLDLIGISVADLLRNPSNYPYYTQRVSDRFASIVERILNNNNFEIAIRTVKTLNTTSYGQASILRLKNVNSDFSDNYREVITNSTKPVVMSGGVFSNLETWEGGGKGLARELVNDGHDVWEIEMNGGENLECETCPDYTYQDQVEYFWPVLIAGVMNYSEKTQVNYIGHSNGCRVALNSLNSHSNGKNGTGFTFNIDTGLYDMNVNLPNTPIDKFLGVACPTTLNDNTPFTESLRFDICAHRSLFCAVDPNFKTYNGDKAIQTLNLTDQHHITLSGLGGQLIQYDSSFLVWLVTLKGLTNRDKISLNLASYYNTLGLNQSSVFNLSNVTVGYLYLINGNIFSNVQNDIIVDINDQYRVFNNTILVAANKKGNLSVFGLIDSNHASIKDNNLVVSKIKEVLK